MIKTDARRRTLDSVKISSKKRKHGCKNSVREERLLLIRKLHGVIYGRDAGVRVYSKLLKKHFWIVNEGLININENNFNDEVVTMAKLADLCYRVTENKVAEFQRHKGTKYRIEK